ncbi:MAG: hypothetical protein WCG06_06820 [Candidatus Omnitrophota bacterium]
METSTAQDNLAKAREAVGRDDSHAKAASGRCESSVPVQEHDRDEQQRSAEDCCRALSQLLQQMAAQLDCAIEIIRGSSKEFQKKA